MSSVAIGGFSINSFALSIGPGGLMWAMHTISLPKIRLYINLVINHDAWVHLFVSYRIANVEWWTHGCKSVICHIYDHQKHFEKSYATDLQECCSTH